jgi:hypothetical protein
VDRAFRAIRRADVVGMVIDAVDGVTQQDFRCGVCHPSLLFLWHNNVVCARYTYVCSTRNSR